MMVETILESSQDFGMSTGALPQWKRELLQRRQARARPPLPAPAPPPPPPPPPPLPPAPDDDEELRYGPGIVKRLKSRYLSLALRDAPRRRLSVLRRAASLEHLLDERPPPAPAPAPRAPRAPRPASLAVAPPPARRDLVKRARSVDALSRLEAREEPPPSPEPRAPRPPRRPQPLLRDAERPPPDVVRSTLRKFESAPPRRAAPPARLSAVLHALERRRSPTPEPPALPLPADPPRCILPPVPVDEPPPPVPVDEPPPPSPPPTPTLERKPALAALPPCVVASPRIGLIARADRSPTGSTPSPSPSPAPSLGADADEVEGAAAPSGSRRVSRAALEEIARAGCSVRYAFASREPLSATNSVLAARGPRRVGVIRPMPAAERSPPPTPPAPRVNGHSTPEAGAASRIGAAGIERAWSGSAVKPAPAPSARARRARAPAPAATSVVFNFSARAEVPDYVENDGIVLRAGRRTRFKAGEPGVVELRPGALAADAGSDAEAGEGEGGPPSPCDVRFVNDNVLINGKSSMPARRDRQRVAKLKLQFDDSLTRTFEYPSETSVCEDPPPSRSRTPSPAPAPDNCASLADNTHIASAALSRYTPSKSCAAAFQLGLDPGRAGAGDQHNASPALNGSNGVASANVNGGDDGGSGGEEGDARPCGADLAKSWSDARAHHTDLLF